MVLVCRVINLVFRGLVLENGSAVLLIMLCESRALACTEAKVSFETMRAVGHISVTVPKQAIHEASTGAGRFKIHHNFAPISRLACSLNTLFKIFPLAVFGISGTNTTPPLSCLYFANLPATCAFSSASISFSPAFPGLLTT